MGGHIKEGLELFNSILSAAGFKLAGGPKRALWSMVLRRLQIRLRGLNFVERDASQISEVDLFRIDICSAIAAGLGAVDLIRAADFQCRHLLLALRAGEPHRIARAIAFEAAQTAAPGRKTRDRASKIAQQAGVLSERLGNPDAIGLSLWANGVSAYCVGDWKRAADWCERSAQILSERCSGLTWELSVANRFLLGALLLQGELAEVSRRVPELLGAAVEQGNIFVSTDLRTRMNLIWLANDEPDSARTEVIAALQAWPQEGCNLQHYSSMLALAQIELYTGDAEVAWRHVQVQWPALQGSLLLRLQIQSRSESFAGAHRTRHCRSQRRQKRSGYCRLPRSRRGPSAEKRCRGRILCAADQRRLPPCAATRATLQNIWRPRSTASSAAICDFMQRASRRCPARHWRRSRHGVDE